MNISPIVVERFGQTMREKLTSGEAPFRKAYLGAIVDRTKSTMASFGSSAARTCWNKRFWRRAALCPGFPVLFANGAPD